MTITLSSQTEALLKEQAGRIGQDADALADNLLQNILMSEASDFENSCAAISEELASDPANDISLAEYRAQFETERIARRHERNTAKKQTVERV